MYNKPTDKQIAEFWKQHGLICKIQNGLEYWYSNNMCIGYNIQGKTGEILPINPNNIFSRAIPYKIRILAKYYEEIGKDDDTFKLAREKIAEEVTKIVKIALIVDNDIALALFWNMGDDIEKCYEAEQSEVLKQAKLNRTPRTGG